MSSKDFVKRMREAGERYSGSGGTGVVGRILIEFGLHRYVANHEFWSFWKPVPSENEMDAIADELKVRLEKAGSADEPTFGVKITVKKDVLSRNEPYKADLQEFIPAWQKDSFDMVCDFMDTADLPMNEIFYGKVQYKANPHFVKMGEAGKKETDQNGVPRYPSVRVPVEKFANEQAARDAVGSSSSSTGTKDGSQYSETVQRNFQNNIAGFEACFDQIVEYFDKVSNGELPYDSADPLPKPLTPPSIKRYVAGMFDCEPSDIDIALSTAPF